MKNEFPLLDSLIMSGEWASTTPTLPEGLKLIEAQEATDRYWFDENDVWRLKEDFGTLAPPYEHMWLESTAHVPIGAPVAGKVSKETRSLRMGYKIECLSRDDFMASRVWAHRNGGMAPFKWAYTFQVFTDGATYDESGRRCVPAAGHLTIDQHGQAVEHWSSIERSFAHKFADPAARTMLNSAVWGNGKAALYAISMMNCRNVSVSPAMTTGRKVGKKSRRAGRPPVEYHKIQLPRPKTSASGSSDLTGTQKLHTARGHFKTYTADAPLMGKNVGTYYWGWQVRGNRKNGEVISSYKVGSAA